MTKIEDAVSATALSGNTAFTNVNVSGASDEYTYDANGNITKDSNKDISNIHYNLLNLPEEVAFTNGDSIKFFYSAEGEKLKVEYVIGGTTTNTCYCANVVYENNNQKYLLNDEGYYDLDGINGGYHYYLKDHLGNNRVVINQSGAVQQTNNYYPYGGTFAYTSTAANNQPYKYSGKEFDTHAGLNWYDYGARHYDPAIARWTTQDKFSEKYRSLSPYQYTASNPLKYIDINGDSIIKVNIIDYSNTISGNNTIYIDHSILNDIKTIFTYAYTNDIKIRINSSFRTNLKQSGFNEYNATTPAKPGQSAHNAGLGIDFNLYHEGKIDCGNKNITTNHPFIRMIKSIGWRWGGDFSKPDKIHMDKKGAQEDFIKLRDINQSQMRGDKEVEALEKYVNRTEELKFPKK